MQFYFIRHAQSTNNALWDSTHQSNDRNEDPELTPLGEQQAKALAQLLVSGDSRGGMNGSGKSAGFGITHLYTSLMLRAVATASVVSEALGIPMQAWVDAHEEGGIYLEDSTTGVKAGLPGKDRAFFASKYPGLELPPDLPNEGWWRSQPYESQEARTERAHRFVDTLLKKHGGTDDRVAVISHGGFYNHFLATLFGQAVRDGTWAILFNTGISRFNFGQGVDIVYLNRTDHLPIDLLS